MDDTTAANLIKSFAMRTPGTFDPVKPESMPVVDAQLAQALHCAAEALESRARLAARRGNVPARNAGKPWTSDEDERLLTAFDGGATLDVLAENHQRTRTGIEARLVRYGRLDERDVRGGLGLRYTAKPRSPPG
jgi:hypothetical protein